MPLAEDGGGVARRAQRFGQVDLAGGQPLLQPLGRARISAEQERPHVVRIDKVAKTHVLAEIANVALHGLGLEAEAVLIASREQSRP